MNTKSNKELFQQHEVVPLRADKGVIPEAVKEKLIELGNPKELIPFYAVYGPGLSEPITFDAIISHQQVADAIEKARGGKLGWQIFSPEKLETFQAESRVIFVEFVGPADMWSVLNETAVLESAPIQDLFAENKVITLKADKGVIPKAFAEELSELGNPKGLYPYYAVYGPAISKPITFDGQITSEQIADALEKAGGDKIANQVALSNADSP